MLMLPLNIWKCFMLNIHPVVSTGREQSLQSPAVSLWRVTGPEMNLQPSGKNLDPQAQSKKTAMFLIAKLSVTVMYTFRTAYWHEINTNMLMFAEFSTPGREQSLQSPAVSLRRVTGPGMNLQPSVLNQDPPQSKRLFLLITDLKMIQFLNVL